MATGTLTWIELVNYMMRLG